MIYARRVLNPQVVSCLVVVVVVVVVVAAATEHRTGSYQQLEHQKDSELEPCQTCLHPQLLAH